MTERDRIYFEMITIAYPLGAEYQELSGIRRLYDAGYRKEEEVRKQLVIKIWNAMKRFGSIADEGRYVDCISVDEFKNYLKEEFGVEVEE